MLTRNNSDSEIHLREHIVNETWLKLILVEYYSKEKPDVKVKVTSFTVAKGSETLESVHSDIIALSIDSEIDEERKSFDFVVKLLPDDPFSRYFVAEAEFDMREIKFYTEVRFGVRGEFPF